MNKSELQQRISPSGKPILIDFWAPWCRPCMASKPILEKLAKEYSDKVEFLPINADNSREILEQYHVFGIPTVITLLNGKEIGRAAGAQNETNYRNMFKALAEGRQIKVRLTQFDRLLRLGAGGLFIMIGIYTYSWLLAGIGSVIAFTGIYDRCPIWNALTGYFRKTLT